MLTKANPITPPQPAPAVRHSTGALTREMRKLLVAGSVTLFATLLLLAYLTPMAYAVSTSLRGSTTDADAPLWPAAPATFTYQGTAYELYRVPTEQGVRSLAAVKKGRQQTTFIDPANPSEEIVWQGRWRTLERVWAFSPRWQNYREAWTANDPTFGRQFLNTAIIAGTGMVGTLLSCTLVAYGFSRFRIPGKGVLFIILIGTIILPPQVTLIPTYTLFNRIGWTNTWLPLIVPHFFANAYNVFLLRQFFMGIPRDLDEAAMIDGAGPLRILRSVILPQSVPAVFAVAMFHFFWAWNDFFGPLIYLSSARSLWPIAVGMQAFNAMYATRPDLIQATTVMAMALPLLIFFLAQKAFMRGVVITGVEK
jgi:multiple sugar transport system permease protein